MYFVLSVFALQPTVTVCSRKLNCVIYVYGVLARARVCVLVREAFRRPASCLQIPLLRLLTLCSTGVWACFGHVARGAVVNRPQLCWC